MATQKIRIAELEIDDKALIASTANIKKSIDQLKQSQKELDTSTKEGGKQFVQNASDLKALNSAYNANVKALSQRTQATADSIVREELMNTVLNTEVQTIKEAREQNKLLNKLRNETNVTTEQGRKDLESLNGALDSNNEFIKENADQYLQQKINIGNYQSALQGVSPQLASIISQLQSMHGALLAQKSAFQASTVGMNATSKALKVFRLALISTGIGAIVVLLGSLVAYLSTTQKGIDAVTSVTRPLQAVFQSLIGVLQKVGENLFNAFSNPKQALDDLYEFVKGNLINRFKAFGVILDGIINLDFGKIKDGVLQGATGVENLTDKLVKAGKESAKFLSDAIDKGRQIDKLTKDIEESENNLILLRAKNLQQIKEQELIAKDKAKTDKQRNEAIQEAIRLSEELTQVEQSILDKKIKVVELEQSLNDTGRKDTAELNKLKADSLAKQQEADATRLRFLGVQNQLQTEAENERKKRVTQAIKDQEILLDKFIQSQGVRKKSTEDQLKFEQEVFNKEKAILDEQLKNKLITQIEYDAKFLQLQNEFTQSRTDLIISEYQRELDLFIQNNQTKIDNEKYFSDESLRIEQERIDAIATKQKEFADKQLLEGVINQQEYNDAINNINEENRIAQEEARIQREEAQKEKDLIDLENKRILDEEKFQNEFEKEREKLELKKQQELEVAEKTGADLELIKEKYKKANNAIDQAEAESKYQSIATVAGQASELLGKESEAGKLASLAQAGINVQLGITKAIAQGGLAGIATGAVVAAKGYQSISKILNTNTKFEKGGIQEIGGNRHANGGTKFYGEDGTTFEAEKGEGIGVLSRSAFKGFMDFNNSFAGGFSGGGKFAGGGIITQAVRPYNGNVDISELQRSIANLKVQVAVEDINTGQGNYAEIVNGANV